MALSDSAGRAIFFSPSFHALFLSELFDQAVLHLYLINGLGRLIPLSRRAVWLPQFAYIRIPGVFDRQRQLRRRKRDHLIT